MWRWLSWFAGVWLTCASLLSTARADYVTFGDGWGSKWDDPVHGTRAVISWGFMPDGTGIGSQYEIAAEVIGGSQISKLQTNFDAANGSGAFLGAVKRALDTWSAAANIEFVGPIADPHPGAPLPSGAAGAIVPDIRIGAFDSVPGTFFNFVGAVGYGPPGNDVDFPDPFAGDIFLNLAAIFFQAPGVEDDPITAWGNDLEGLILHELGHSAIGLDHPDSGPSEVMYVGPGSGEFINRQLSPDDIAGAQVVYGPQTRVVGDATHNGIVDIADYTVWADHFLQTTLRGSERGDLNGDGFVDVADYTVWADHFAPVLAAAAAVPEPSTLLLAGIAIVAIIAPRCRRR